MRTQTAINVRNSNPNSQSFAMTRRGWPPQPRKKWADPATKRRSPQSDLLRRQRQRRPQRYTYPQNANIETCVFKPANDSQTAETNWSVDAVVVTYTHTDVPFAARRARRHINQNLISVWAKSSGRNVKTIAIHAHMTQICADGRVCGGRFSDDEARGCRVLLRFLIWVIEGDKK